MEGLLISSFLICKHCATHPAGYAPSSDKLIPLQLYSLRGEPWSGQHRLAVPHKFISASADSLLLIGVVCCKDFAICKIIASKSWAKT